MPQPLAPTHQSQTDEKWSPARGDNSSWLASSGASLRPRHAHLLSAEGKWKEIHEDCSQTPGTYQEKVKAAAT